MYCYFSLVCVLSVLLAKLLARKTPLRKPNHGEGIVSRKPRPKCAYDFLGLLIVSLFYDMCLLSHGRT